MSFGPYPGATHPQFIQQLLLGLGVLVGTGRGVGVHVGGGTGVHVGGGIGVHVGRGVFVGIGVLVGVLVAVNVAVAVGTCSLTICASDIFGAKKSTTRASAQPTTGPSLLERV